MNKFNFLLYFPLSRWIQSIQSFNYCIVIYRRHIECERRRRNVFFIFISFCCLFFVVLSLTRVKYCFMDDCWCNCFFRFCYHLKCLLTHLQTATRPCRCVSLIFEQATVLCVFVLHLTYLLFTYKVHVGFLPLTTYQWIGSQMSHTTH